MSTPPTVAIIGGGVAGAMTAVQLARTASAPNVVLLDRAGSFARGAAYSTRSATHLLNVPAGRMSVFMDDAEHFLRWARTRLGAAIAADAFLPRSLYGDYVAETLTATMRDHGSGIRLVHGTAIDVEAGPPARIRCADGSLIVADQVVVALGNEAPPNPPVEGGASFYASPRYTANPWAPHARSRRSPPTTPYCSSGRV